MTTFSLLSLLSRSTFTSPPVLTTTSQLLASSSTPPTWTARPFCSCRPRETSIASPALTAYSGYSSLSAHSAPVHTHPTPSSIPSHLIPRVPQPAANSHLSAHLDVGRASLSTSSGASRRQLFVFTQLAFYFTLHHLINTHT